MLIAAFALLTASCTLQPNVASLAPNAHVGSAAPSTTGTSLAGSPLSIDFQQNKKTVLVFWAAWCGPCRHEQPGLNTLAAEFAAQGVHFYGIDMLDHDQALARAFVAEFNVAYLSLYDDSGTTAARYEVDAPPSIVLVNTKGVIVGRFPGEATESQLRALIRQTLLI